MQTLQKKASLYLLLLQLGLCILRQQHGTREDVVLHTIQPGGGGRHGCIELLLHLRHLCLIATRLFVHSGGLYSLDHKVLSYNMEKKNLRKQNLCCHVLYGLPEAVIQRLKGRAVGLGLPFKEWSTGGHPRGSGINLQIKRSTNTS